MHTRLSKALNGLRSSLPTRRQSALLVVISAVCVATPLVSLVGLQHKSDELMNNPTSPEQELSNGRYRALKQQHDTAIALIGITTGIGLLSALATFYLLQRLYRELLHREAQLQDTNALLKAIEGSVTDSLFTLNSEGQIETLNPAALRMFGYDSSEMVGKSLNILLDQTATDSPDPEKAEVQRSQKGVARRKLGASFPVELSIGQVVNHHRRVAIVRDITQQEHLAAELQSRLKELAQITMELTQARVDLQQMYMTCHDLKSPLQAIVHLSKWIEADLNERVRADTQNQIDLLQERVHRMEGLVNTILESAPPKNQVQV
ncbi:PAS domain S-box protein [Oscillatoria sp. FACHB-1407]|uniref:PAS domain S-box protein n=1 Tax=Oscillatoria sp. FACHB-1407 TaxID=2692847 RepID=UPI001688ACCD|nr:PAS domain S-box protein [Oscillatoria sp. FACHB-1407]MBD2462624.1 PAS domain S-box protein [Oscillatoria sp. FACHB-1407]